MCIWTRRKVSSPLFLTLSASDNLHHNNLRCYWKCKFLGPPQTNWTRISEGWLWICIFNKPMGVVYTHWSLEALFYIVTPKCFPIATEGLSYYSICVRYPLVYFCCNIMWEIASHMNQEGACLKRKNSHGWRQLFIYFFDECVLERKN